ncbi:MAG: chalcone isomerase family protein [bacterium]
MKFKRIVLVLILSGLAWLPASANQSYTARACYWGFIQLYDADYSQDTDGGACIKLTYLRDFSAEQLAEATIEIFEKVHGLEETQMYRRYLDRTANDYQEVEAGDQYRYCTVDKTGGFLQLNNGPKRRYLDVQYADRLMKIWVLETRQGQPIWNFKRCKE